MIDEEINFFFILLHFECGLPLNALLRKMLKMFPHFRRTLCMIFRFLDKNKIEKHKIKLRRFANTRRKRSVKSVH